MAKHLTTSDITAIVNLIHGWKQSRITWEAICEEASKVVSKKPTRQSLNSNHMIKTAYLSKKQSLKLTGMRSPTPGNLRIASERLARLESELHTLKFQNSSLLEQFVKWQYNAYKYGIKEHQLNEPLPHIDRDRTDGR